MPFAELITPSLKQDDATQAAFKTTAYPLLAKLLGSAPGVKAHFIAPMLTENGIEVGSSIKNVIGLEWESPELFRKILTSPELETFIAQVKPLVTAPAQPELYETDLSPMPAFSSPLTEVFRFHVGNGGNDIHAIRVAWQEFVTALQRGVPNIISLSGTSVNLEQELFAGILGWESVEIRNSIDCREEVKEYRSKLRGFEGVNSFTVSLVAQ